VYEKTLRIENRPERVVSKIETKNVQHIVARSPVYLYVACVSHSEETLTSFLSKIISGLESETRGCHGQDGQ